MRMNDDSPNMRTASARVNKHRLWIVFGLTTGYMFAEAVTGILTKSLALLADAGHMLTDAGALGLSLLAVRFSERPSTPGRSFGYYRAEILAAFVNSLALLLMSFYIVYEAWQRFKNPPVVASWPVLIVAIIGMVVNLAGIRLLGEFSGKSLNVKAAYLEVMSDLLGSLGVVAAGIIMLTTGWYRADPVFGAAIGLFIVPRTWKLLKDVVHILMEGAPSDLDLDKLKATMRSVPDVARVHDLHVWTLTSGVNAMTAHVWTSDGADDSRVLRDMRRIAKGQFGIEHTTIQIEKECESAAPF
jgi:cobalt-zinc-cadmium efflux system protein